MYVRVRHIFLDFKVSSYIEGYSFWVLWDLKFKISEGSDQNWSCPESAQLAVSAKLRQLPGQTRTTSIWVQAFGNFKLKVPKYSRNCSLQYTLIPPLLSNPTAPPNDSNAMPLFSGKAWMLDTVLSLHSDTSKQHNRYRYILVNRALLLHGLVEKCE